MSSTIAMMQHLENGDVEIVADKIIKDELSISELNWELQQAFPDKSETIVDTLFQVADYIIGANFVGDN